MTQGHLGLLLERITNTPVAAFEQQIVGKKVILLYPLTPYRNVFLAYFLRTTPDKLVYYRLKQPYTQIAAWLNDLVADVSANFSGFGAHLKALPAKSAPSKLGAALAADLGALRAEGVIFYIDELDRVAHSNDFRTLMRTCAAALPAHVQLVISSRRLRYQPWIEIVEKGDASVLGTMERSTNLLFTVNGTLRPQLEIYGFGRGHALINGTPIENWDGLLPRNLFFYFADHDLVTRQQIFEVFWPRLATKEATNVFHVTKRKITECLNAWITEKGDYEMTAYASGFYTPGANIVRHYDVADFEAALQRASNTLDETEEEREYRRAITIYRAPFLTTIDMPWVVERREKLRLMFVDALTGLGRWHKRQHQWDMALGYFLRALKEMPQREDLHRQAMEMYWQMGRASDAQQQYYLLAGYLDKTIGVPPSRETRELFEKIAAAH